MVNFIYPFHTCKIAIFEFQYITSSAFVQAFQYPSVDAEEDGPMVVSANIQCASITQGTYST